MARSRVCWWPNVAHCQYGRPAILETRLDHVGRQATLGGLVVDAPRDWEDLMEPNPAPPTDDLRAFLLVLRRALLSVTTYIEKRYNVNGEEGKVTGVRDDRKTVYKVS